MVIKRCQICNEVFNFRTSKQKYCKDCRPIAQREYKAQWHKENYEYVEKTNKPRICEYCGSINDVWFYKKEIMLCKSHYLEMYSTGMFRSDDEKGYKHNLIYKPSHIEIHFKNGEIGLFDLDDEELVKNTYWGIDVAGYIHGKVNGKLARYHRHLFNFPKETIDHINRDKLDNRKNNLRLCSQKENSRNLSLAKNNTSGVTGVTKTKHGTWKARITVDRKEIHLGNYKSLDKAAKARRNAEIKYFGDYAPKKHADHVKINIQEV